MNPGILWGICIIYGFPPISRVVLTHDLGDNSPAPLGMTAESEQFPLKIITRKAGEKLGNREGSARMGLNTGV